MGAKQGLEHVVGAARLAELSGHWVRLVLMGNGNQGSDFVRRAKGAATST